MSIENCTKCDGTGFINPVCEECGRDGFVPDPSDGGYMTCEECDGDSAETCSACEGDGCIEQDE